jgi:D-aminopeptidase
VGAGAGTVAFGWKGGIGSSSRLLPRPLGGWTVGVLVQSNFGGVLTVGGARVGEALGRHPFTRALADSARPSPPPGTADGSIVMVIATDAPLSDRNLRRLASRALLGLGRTGSYASNGSGDYVIAFSTAREVRRAFDAPRVATTELANDGGDLSALFAAAADATEEAIYDSLFAATTVTSRGGTVQAIPLDRVREVLRTRGGAPGAPRR